MQKLKSSFDPKDDGITHLNIYSKAKTALGVFLSNFYQCDLETEDGSFQSIEGYWYWLLAQDLPEKENLRQLFGYEAKVLGRKLLKLESEDCKDEFFQEKIQKAIIIKINDHPRFKSEFTRSTLPLAHYYVSSGKVKIGLGDWVVDFLSQLREQYKRFNVT